MLRLSRLPPVRERLRVQPFPAHAPARFLDPARSIDPAHPAARSKLPSFVSPHFTIRALPNPVLHQPTDYVPLNPLLATALLRARTHTHARCGHTEPQARPSLRDSRTRCIQLNTQTRIAAFDRRNLSLHFRTSKKATSKSAVVRNRLRSKMTAAITLVVRRSADAVDPPGTGRLRPTTPYPPLDLVHRPLPEGERFVLQDWTYLVIPELSVYRMPLPHLVQQVRKALLSLSRQSLRLESSWSSSSRTKATGPPVDEQPRHSPPRGARRIRACVS